MTTDACGACAPTPEQPKGDRYPHVRAPAGDGRCRYCGQREGVCPGLNVRSDRA